MKRIILVGIFIFLGTLTSSTSLLENPNGNAHGFCKLDSMRQDNTPGITEGDELVIYLEQVQSPMTGLDIDQLFSSNDTTETFGELNTMKKRDKDKKDALHETIKVRTKLKCVESVLKNAVIEPYFINGQIKGLKISSLNGISEAKNLLLKSSDIILAVNGQTLSSMKDAYDIFKKARKKPIMIVDLLRDGEVKKLLFDFQ